MILLLTYGVLAVVFSFLCSVWEAVLLSMPDSYVEIKKAAKDPIAPFLAEMKNKQDKSISAILSLNTLAHTVGAIMVGTQAESVFGKNGFDILGYELPFTGVVAAIMTIAILILSEIIPKTLGSNNWKGLAGFTAKSLKIVVMIMSPLVALSEFITKKLKGSGHSKKISREEMAAMASMGSREGLFNSGETKIITNLMRFHTVKVESIMTPRTVVKAADEKESIASFYENNQALPFSRVLVYDTTIDNITGYILKDVLLEKLIKEEGHVLLKKITRKITIVDHDQDIQSVFNLLLGTKEHIALVTDKFGGMAGIITVEDIIETLLGLEIVDETDNTVDMQALARQNWEKRARKMGIIEEEDNNEGNEN